MELNVAGSWAVFIAPLTIVVLGGTTLTAAYSGMAELARAGVIGMVLVIVAAAVVIAGNIRRITMAASDADVA